MSQIQGIFKARAVEWGLGCTDKGSEYIAVSFEILEGEHAGKRVTWPGYFTDKTTDRTIDSLRYCGWSCDNIAALTGMGTADVEIVVEVEDYQARDGAWKKASRVRWVNRPSSLQVRGAMDAAAAKSFAERMMGNVIQRRQNGGAAPATPTAPAQRPAAVQPRAGGFAPPPAGFADDGAPDYSDTADELGF